MILVQERIEYINNLNDVPLTAIPFDGCSCDIYFELYNSTKSSLKDSGLDYKKLIFCGEIDEDDLGLTDIPFEGNFFRWIGPEKDLSISPSVDVLVDNEEPYSVDVTYNRETSTKIKSGDLIVISSVIDGRISRIDLVSKNTNLPFAPTSVFIENESCEVTKKDELWYFRCKSFEKGIKTKKHKRILGNIHYGGNMSPTSSLVSIDFDGKVLRNITIKPITSYTTEDSPDLYLTGTSNIESDDVSDLSYFVFTESGTVGHSKGVTVTQDKNLTRILSLSVYPVYDGLQYDNETVIEFPHFGDFDISPTSITHVLIYTKKTLFKAVGNNDVGTVSAIIVWPDGTEKELPFVEDSFVLTDDLLNGVNNYEVKMTLTHESGYKKDVFCSVIVESTEDIDSDDNPLTKAKYYFRIIFNMKKDD